MGVERILGNEMADGEQAAVAVEEEIELHGGDQGAGRDLDGLQPTIQRRARLGVLRDVAAVARDRPLHGLDPEQHILARGIGPFVGQHARQVGGLAGASHQVVQPVGKPQQRRGNIVERTDQFLRR